MFAHLPRRCGDGFGCSALRARAGIYEGLAYIMLKAAQESFALIGEGATFGSTVRCEPSGGIPTQDFQFAGLRPNFDFGAAAHRRCTALR
eukprot:SAG11_NODE_1917_length_4070_cov_3.642156_5_plen_90_part_00